MRKIAVLYCLRQEDGIETFIEFINALGLFPIEHAKLHILLKTTDETFIEQISEILMKASLSAHVHPMPIWGFDLGTYKLFIENSKDDFFVLMSATSRPTKYNWVNILTAPLISDNCSVVGSMGSWESLSTEVFESYTIAFENKIIKLHKTHSCRKIKYFGRLQFNLKTFVLKLLVRRLPILRVLSRFGAVIYFLLHPRIIWRRTSSFPKFPNPHIRTTGMAISRDLFLQACKKTPSDKLDCLLLESGRESITRLAALNGCNPVVAIDEQFFSLNNEQVQRSFRSVDQMLPLVVDHHYMEFKDGSSDFQKRMRRITWGPYSEMPAL
jgi:hypothetical protein